MVQVCQGKLNFTAMNNIPEGASVLTGTFSINDTPVKILFDSGATHSFISQNLLGKLGLKGMQTKSAYHAWWKHLFSPSNLWGSFKVGK
jgi:hypothetical protein